MADWARLHNDLLLEIGKRLISIESYDSFGSVCKSWRAAAIRDKHHLQQKTFESMWFMLSSVSQTSQTDMQEFFSLASGKTHEILFPEVSKKCFLSWKDWLFIIEKDKIHTSLLHVISRVQIHLPTFPIEIVIKGVVLSANPNTTSDFTVMIIMNEFQLSFCNPGDKFWTTITKSIHRFDNIIYYNYYFYALDAQCAIFRCDVNGQNQTRTQLQQPFEISGRKPIRRSYMVEFSNKLFVVHRYINIEEGILRTIKCQVYEVNMEDNKLVETNNLGNKAIFVGYSTTFVVTCSEINNYKPNCIYFTDDDRNQYFFSVPGLINYTDICIYHLFNGNIETLFRKKMAQRESSPPTWNGPGF